MNHLKRLLFPFLLFCCTLPFTYATAQDTLAIDFTNPVNGIDLRSVVSVYHDRDEAFNMQDFASMPFEKDTSIFHARRRPLYHINNIWLKLSVKNTGTTDTSLSFFTGYHDEMEWFTADANGNYHMSVHTGLMIDKGDVGRWARYGFPVKVAAGHTQTFYLHIVNHLYRENRLMPLLFDALHYAGHRQQHADHFKKEALVIQVLIGMLLVLLCITLINYTQLPDRSSLYFAGYVLGLIFFFSLRLETKPFQLSFFHYFPMFKYYWDIPALLFCFYLMPLLFGNMFLSLRERYPLMEKFYRYSAILIGALIVVSFGIIALGEYQLAAIIYSWFHKLSIVPLAISFIALTRRIRHHPLIRFFLLGSLSVFVLSIWSFAVNKEPVGLTSIPELTTPNYVILVGILLQAMCYAAGLSYRNKLVHQERTKTQEMLIRQLNKNKELQHKLNEQLEELVKEQTTEILRKNQELEDQRKLQLDVEYSKKLAEIELKAIRAQINPHFIFNCLNSIQLFVMQRDYEHAQKYLSDFSYLIRKTLDFSRRNFISLSDEITYLNTYLGLEKMRFEQKMSYEIVIDPVIAAAELEVPAMLLQPYVENAVKHGMTNPDHGRGLLTIRFNELEPDMLECVIEDNGIGIARSKALRSMPSHHQSSGMEISLNRAELLNKMYNTGIQIEIIDKSSKQASNSGTIIRILIPQL